MIPTQHLRDQPHVELSRLAPYRGPHTQDHDRPTRYFGRAYRWRDNGTGTLHLIPDPEGQVRIDRAVAAARRIWSPR